jgi:hypothetical protein
VGFRGVHTLALAAIVLGAVAVRSTEVYASRYQSLPALDWLESRPPLAQASTVPPAIDIARGLLSVMPLLVIRDDAHTVLPAFGPPPSFQRTIAGVRDASRIQLGSPGDYPMGQVPVSAQFDVIVFDRIPRALAWSELMNRAMANGDPGWPQDRLTGPDEADATWVPRPAPNHGGMASVVGTRGPVGFVLRITFLNASDAAASQLADSTARAEVLAREATGDWSAWLAPQLST